MIELRRIASCAVLVLAFGRLTVVAQSGAPSVAHIYPNAGVPGTTFSAIIKGANLEGATSVDFSGTGVTAAIGTGGTGASLPITVTMAPDAAA